LLICGCISKKACLLLAAGSTGARLTERIATKQTTSGGCRRRWFVKQTEASVLGRLLLVLLLLVTRITKQAPATE